MLKTELLETIHPGGLPDYVQAQISEIEQHFIKQRTGVSVVTLLPNFCIDNDMQSYLSNKYKEFENIPIYRGLLVEVRPSYKISIEDARWIYPQLYKTRGLVQLPKSADLNSIKDRMASIKETSASESKQNEICLSEVYNSIGIYMSQSAESDFGILENKSYVGYDISIDEHVIPIWYEYMQKGLAAEEIYAAFFSDRLIHGTTIKNLVMESANAFIELVTDASIQSLAHVTDISYNCFYSNKHAIFFFNHAMNLLGAASRPPILNRSCAAGYTLFKPRTCNNNHAYNFAWPIDTGFSGEFHEWDSMHIRQKDRVERCFMWERKYTSFNTWLMKTVNSDKTPLWKQIENQLQVVPDKNIALNYARVSTHKYNNLCAKEVLKIHPGDSEELVAFPMQYTHEIINLLVSNYAEVHKQVHLIKDEFYDSKTNSILVPKYVARNVVNGYGTKHNGDL